MIAAFVPILIFALIMVALSVVMIVLSHFLTPSKYASKKTFDEPYECGLKTDGITEGRYPVKFYLVAILFVIFDIEAVFLWPWAISFKSFSEAGASVFWYAEMLVFIIILLVGYFYVVGKGALDWK